MTQGCLDGGNGDRREIGLRAAVPTTEQATGRDGPAAVTRHSPREDPPTCPPSAAEDSRKRHDLHLILDECWSSRVVDDGCTSPSRSLGCGPVNWLHGANKLATNFQRRGRRTTRRASRGFAEDKGDARMYGPCIDERVPDGGSRTPLHMAASPRSTQGRPGASCESNCTP
ncbi:hypothetical protein L226DRAFT_243576 [Lentinus tigrinus ALCF2SS1-7]|uniref:Uncharacterized protein n=1 Tax=Lentinus tigrinus ALCF2SS1-6 TaxID=1328759 RepID=A0A5C2SP53_9APHY|nr:hypothetical protein L227DRAFT_210389 [Lentinus tigrinus ALCF2SS1-6]RPD79192.1 hypothetical protein L226DRAFT_243576 [Lentinus tigrinus ALCF2SS1-7]